MSGEAHARVRALFERVVDLPPGARSIALDQVRDTDPETAAEVESLLRFHEADGALLDRGPSGLTDLPGTDSEPGPGAVGDWSLGPVLGSGGTFIIHRATRASDGLPGAVKIVRPELVTRGMVERFARAGWRWVKHEDIAATYSCGVEPGPGAPRPYIAVEFVEGGTLTDAFRPGGLPLSARVPLMARLCAAVAAGHAQGIVHGHLTPERIRIGMRADGPWLKVMDFGLARLADDAAASSGHGTGLRPGLSRMRGLSIYAAPELRTDRPAPPDAACDVYALGMIVAELGGVARASGPSSPKPLHPALREVVARAAAAAPKDRFGSAHELAEALLAVAHSDAGADRKAGWVRRALGRRA